MEDSTEATSPEFERIEYNPARYWDYLLGGYHNFEADRKVADRTLEAFPDVRLGALANRSFLRRAVRFLARSGISQFVDLGSGIPTVGPVHEIAQAIDPGSRVVYVDHDPVAVTHSQSILAGNPKAHVIEEDFRNVAQIFDRPGFSDWIDLREPIGVLLVAVLHFVRDDAQAAEMLRQLHSRMAHGSYLVISHYSLDGAPEAAIQRLSRVSAAANDPSKSRSSVEIGRLFDGFELLKPGVVRIPLWRPEGPDEILVEEPERCLGFAGVGQKK